MSESLTVFMKTSKLQSRQKTINNINSWKRRRLKYCTIIFFEAIETQQLQCLELISSFPNQDWDGIDRISVERFQSYID